MAGEETTDSGTVRPEYNMAVAGLNMDQSVNQVGRGQLTYALNAAVENFDSNSINYQNEPGNEFCLKFPDGYQLIGEHFINEQAKHIFFLVNSSTGDSEIGYMDNNDCVYKTYINAKCLNFNIKYPIHKTVHKITNCTTEVYWTDGLNPRRYIDLTNLPYKIQPGTSVCDDKTIPEVDCNKLKIQPDFSIPNLEVVDITSGGDLVAGTYQFAIQYCDSSGGGFTSYYSVTNPTPIANPQLTTPNFNYRVGRSIVLNITNIDVTGYYQYYNLAVIKTINDITSVELVGTYFIDDRETQVTYTGQNVTQIRLSIDDIFEKFPYYDIAQDLTAVQDILVWDNLTSIDRINYQKIANQIGLQWETYRIPSTENYANELNATNLRGYLRDEVYAFEIVFLLRNGKQTDGFHIPGREKNFAETSQPDVSTVNADFIGEPTYYLGPIGYSPYWKIYNTGYKIANSPGRSTASDYKGPWEYGGFSYWESTEVYPCNEEVWGDLANQPIRHHKFPDVLVSPIFENPVITYSGTQIVPVMTKDAIFPIGVKVDIQQIQQLIGLSGLTQEQKNDVIGFKIVRGNRGTNKSIVAKGILRNVGQYERDETTYFFPNYPYNDIKPDPFLQKFNNAYYDQCSTYQIVASTDGQIEYIDCFTAELATMDILIAQTYKICSLSVPRVVTGTATVTADSYSIYKITNFSAGSVTFNYRNPATPDVVSTVVVFLGSPQTINSVIEPTYNTGTNVYIVEKVGEVVSDKVCNSSANEPLEGFDDDSKYRYVFNSPETSFGQPFLGDTLKLESVMFGAGKAHFVQVKDNARYRLLTKEAQQDALVRAWNVGNITAPTFSASAMFAVYQTYLEIYVNGITRRNYGYSFNSIASYDYAFNVDNGLGIKQRPLDIRAYLIPAVQSVGDVHSVNNFQRESSVYLRTDLTRSSLPFAEQTPTMTIGPTSILTDDSRYIISQKPSGCNNPEKIDDISVVSYYGSLKNIFINQWGQMYSYETLDTGFQMMFSPSTPSTATVFGGDTFITRFAFKTKLPFFIDNRVKAADDSDIFYDEIGNVAYPKYWHSSRSVLEDANINGLYLSNFISFKAHNFDCPNTQLPIPQPDGPPSPNRTFYDGKFYMFAYGVPNFYCETSYNVDLRQAFNDREGDFWPHVTTDIPDDWVQESYVPIAQDNTYYYNVTFSKQNKENVFTHLPIDWTQDLCNTYFPFRAIYSDRQQTFSNEATNNWLIYRPTSTFDFPQNYGKLTSLDGIQNRAILARFENKTLMYNNLLTIDTSNPQAAYVGNSRLFEGSPPIDFAETDLGYAGSQHKMLLKIPQGQVTIDAKRGQVFLLTGGGAKDLSAFGSGLNRFFTDHLAFEILRYFPKVNVDNNYNNIGLHGVYDSKYDRVIITKLDYIPQPGKTIVYDDVNQQFFLEELFENETIKSEVFVSDPEYFCNKSWTLSFNFNTNSWISFHTYIPNWYIGENNFFYSGLNESCDIEAIAFEEVPVTTTTTSSTSSTSTTSTSTTAVPLPDCTLIADPIVQIDCRLEGSALRPGTTTTTSSTSTTSTSTSTTSTTTTQFDAPKCADCTPILDNVTDNGVGLLSVGNMTSPLCVLGDYVIDWYLDSTSNPIEFTSGNVGNPDPAIQQFHPFTGTSARPSQGGSWIPVIRYAELDGIVYYSTPTPGQDLATDLATCLTPITVLNLNCINGTNSTVGFEQYSHRYEYQNGLQSPSDASKTLAFTLNSDGSTQYFAWYFQGANISDRIRFTYVSPLNTTSTVLQDFAIGNDISATDFSGAIKLVKASQFRYVIDLTGITYALGDYLLIDIISGYVAPLNPNTNWVAYFKCLTTFDTSWTRTVFDDCSPVMTQEASLCRYKLEYGFTTFDDNLNTDIYKYLVGAEGYVFTAASPTNATPTDVAYFSDGLLSCTPTLIGPYDPSCTPAAGTITITKTANSWVYSFSSVTDFNKYQTEYNTAISNVTPIGPVPPNTDINYFRFVRFWVQKFNNDNCGDTATTNTNVIIHYLEPVTFDAINLTMSFTVNSIDPAPYYATLPPTCAGDCATLSYVGFVNTAASSITNLTVVTGTTQVTTCDATYYVQTSAVDTAKTRSRRMFYGTPYYPTVPSPLTNGWYNEVITPVNRRNSYYDYYNICTITDLLDPINNFKIESYIEPSGVFPSPVVTIYEISGGVVVIGCSTTTTTTTAPP